MRLIPFRACRRTTSGPPGLGERGVLATCAITTGELKPGDRLPSWPELRQRYGLVNLALQCAVFVLRFQGRVITRGGSGVYVRGPGNPDATSFDLIATDQRINEILDRMRTLRTRGTVLVE